MSDYGDQSFHAFQSGIIYRKSPDWLNVAADGGSLIVQEVLNESGRNIIQDIKVGDRFVTPSNYLEGRYGRVVYTAKGKK